MSRYNEDIEIAMKIYEQTYSNFRHWDQIRWLVPYWFITVFTVLLQKIWLFYKTSEKTSQWNIYML